METTKIKTDKIIANVFETYDYSKFKSLKGNRIINEPNFLRIKESMDKQQLFNVIIVNEKNEIIDGNHRFKTCKELNLPVYYVVCNGYSLEEVQILNANSKNWTKNDFLDSYCELGYPQYITMRNFMRRHKNYSIGVSMSLLSLANNGGYKTKIKIKKNIFKLGEFKCKDVEKSHDITIQLTRLAMVTELYNRRSFVIAYMKVYLNPNFNYNTFFDKMNRYQSQIIPCINMEQYLLMFEKIYNYRNSNKVNLRY